MRINIRVVLVVLVALLAVTRLSRHQYDTQRICTDDPSASDARGETSRISVRGSRGIRLCCGMMRQLRRASGGTLPEGPGGS
jgi:hypothetical protein